MKTKYTVIRPDRPHETHEIDLPKEPRFERIEALVSPLLDGGNIEHVNVLADFEGGSDYRRSDMFVDERGHDKLLPFNEAASAIYRRAHLTRHPSTDPKSSKRGIAVALGGDTTMLRTLIGLLIPARRRPVKFEIPVINNAKDALLASRLIVASTAAGEITPEEAAQLGKVLELHARLLEVHDLEGRLVELERERGIGTGTSVQ
jgi:hypothetical protein